MFSPMPSRFHSIVVDVADFDSAVADYARLLGLQADWIESGAQSGTLSALFPLSNMMLEIRGRASTSASTTAPLDDPPDGLSGIRLGCDELERLLDQLGSMRSAVHSSLAQKAERSDGEAVRSWVSTTLDPSFSRSISIEVISDEAGPRPGWMGDHRDPSASNSKDPESAIRGLDHVVVFSSDIEATRDLYAEGMGIRLALDRSFEKRGVRLIFFRIGGVTIEIAGRLGAKPRSDAADRFGGLAWQAPELDATHSRLKADGFDISEIRDGHKPGTRVCTVRDPVHNVPTLLIESVS